MVFALLPVNRGRVIVRARGSRRRLTRLASAVRAARQLRRRGAVVWIARLPDAGVVPECRPLGGF